MPGAEVTKRAAGAEVAAVVFAGFVFVRAAGGFMAAEFGHDGVRRDDRLGATQRRRIA